MSVRRRVVEFAESRGSLVSLARWLGSEPVPRRGGWLYTLGSLAGLLFLVQLLTGLLLAGWYAPSPDHAHASVIAIESRLPGGSLVRGIHHWGASAMVIAVALHLLRTFWFGAYRKPRELNWLAGVGLLLLTLGFGFTGYLLPWDQKAYWATVVGTQAPATLPVLGPLVARLMTGGESVGAWTLTRFYSLHTMLLPLLTLGLVAFHVGLMRLHGHAGPTAPPDPREPFFPYQAARDAVVFTGAVAVIVLAAWRFPAPLEAIANPADASYVPRPEWYFLPLFELLKLFKGPLEPIATAVIPGLSLILLALVPWLDRGADRRPSSRGVVLGSGALAVACLGVLLGVGFTDLPAGGARQAGLAGGPPPDPAVLLGAASFEKRGCASCHGPGGRGGGQVRDSVTLVGRTFTKDEEGLTEHALKNSATTPGQQAPEEGDMDLPSLVAYVSSLRNGPVDLSRIPTSVRLGGAVVDREECRKCHKILGEGSGRGPALAGLAGRRDREWLVGHFVDPKRFVPGSKMPPVEGVPRAELEAMADYLLALP